MLVGIIGDDAGDRQAQRAAGTRNIHHVAQLESAQHREIFRSQHGFALRGQPEHLLGIAGHRRQRGMFPQIVDIGRDKHGRLALDLDARVAHQLHVANTRDRP